MEYSIKNFQPLRILNDDKSIIILNGYAFIDKFGYCIIIVYGESKRDDIILILK